MDKVRPRVLNFVHLKIENAVDGAISINAYKLVLFSDRGKELKQRSDNIRTF
jgi:hypothetical protein